ncbi:hypothetical protein [Nonomuraea zeae]|uniref:Uncharacterized protein n=1 Tax=Nonomuraea zeae TaxID=1642303 RepID=A0A5S4H2U5_9ACTN|nr:hypothetical protein [Nonomuraea zeae]TMR39573.1 hypothetical protein ETD85_00745 [Nonomuraea zeae]
MMHTPIPRPEQIDNIDPITWRVIPSESNPDRHEHGGWAIAAGHGEEYDLYIEVADAAYPREVAEFMVAAVQAHAGRLRLSAVLENVQSERKRLRESKAVTPYQLETFRLRAMMAKVGQLAAELEPRESDKQHDEIYGLVTQVAALAVTWLEDMHANYGMPTESL